MVLLRELSVAFDGSELILLLGLACWLLGSGLGAAAGTRNGTPAPLLLRGLLLAYALLLPLSAAGARALPSLLQAARGVSLPLHLQLLGTLAILLPSALLAGALFRVAARAWLAPGRSLAQAYGLESVGALLGGVLSTAVAHIALGNLVLAVLTALLTTVAAAWPGPGQRGWMRLLTLPASVLLVLLLAASGPLDRALTGLEHPDLIASRDTPYGRVSVEQREEQVAVFLNGALSFESQGYQAEAFVHPAALQAVSLDRVLLLGGVGQGLLSPLLQHRPNRVVLVEPDPVLLQLMRTHLPEVQRLDLDDPTVRTHMADPRAFLDAPDRFDLILVSQPEPATAASSRTYTAEFFALCADRLSPGGVLAFSTAGAENLWTPTLTWRNAGLHRALLSSFDDVLVLPGTSNLWLASRAPLERTGALLAHRLRDRGVRSDLVTEPWLEYQLGNDRSAEIASLLEATPAPANRDDRPTASTLTLLLWLGRFDPRLALQDPGPLLASAARLAPAALGGAALTLLLTLAALRRWAGSRRFALALTAGLLGTLLESVLLMRFQVQHGVLFGHLGLLLGAFMAGLALGALGIDLLLRQLAGEEEPPRWLGWAMGLAALGVAGAVLAAPWLQPGIGTSAGLLLAAGASTAALFGMASVTGQPDAARVAGSLYAVDLLGGCVGITLASAVLIPLVGMSATSIAAAVVAAGALLLLL